MLGAKLGYAELGSPEAAFFFFGERESSGGFLGVSTSAASFSRAGPSPIRRLQQGSPRCGAEPRRNICRAWPAGNTARGGGGSTSARG
jgi:hypothetical protein